MNITAAFLIGDTIKVKLKTRWYDSTSLFFFFIPIEERSITGTLLIWETPSPAFLLKADAARTLRTRERIG